MERKPPKPTFHVRPASRGYELRQAGVEGVIPMADEASALWAAAALCPRAGGKIIVLNRKGQTVRTKNIAPKR